MDIESQHVSNCHYPLFFKPSRMAPDGLSLAELNDPLWAQVNEIQLVSSWLESSDGTDKYFTHHRPLEGTTGGGVGKPNNMQTLCTGSGTVQSFD